MSHRALDAYPKMLGISKEHDLAWNCPCHELLLFENYVVCEVAQRKVPSVLSAQCHNQPCRAPASRRRSPTPLWWVSPRTYSQDLVWLCSESSLSMIQVNFAQCPGFTYLPLPPPPPPGNIFFKRMMSTSRFSHCDDMRDGAATAWTSSTRQFYRLTVSTH